MKLNGIILAALCGITAFAGENIKFKADTRPAQKKLSSKKAITSLLILPENLKQDRFCRITVQIKMTSPGTIVSAVRRGNEKPLWRQTGMDAGWRNFSIYIAPGKAWNCSLGVSPKGNTFQVKDIRVEALDEEDLTKNLLPPMKEIGWYSVWAKKEAKIGFEKSEDSPFGAEVLTAEISEGTGYPATLGIPVVPGRTLVVSMWVKGEQKEAWLATIIGCGTKTFPVTGEWRKQELKFKVKAETPAVSDIVFWKNKNKKPLKCLFGKVEACYEK